MSLNHCLDSSSLTPDLDVSFASLKVAGTPILPDQARSTFKITWAGDIDDAAVLLRLHLAASQKSVPGKTSLSAPVQFRSAPGKAVARPEVD